MRCENGAPEFRARYAFARTPCVQCTPHHLALIPPRCLLLFAASTLPQAQNATYHDVKLCVTRMGDSSKMVIIFDPEQCDRTRGNFAADRDAVRKFLDTYRERDDARVITLTEVVRGGVND